MAGVVDEDMPFQPIISLMHCGGWRANWFVKDLPSACASSYKRGGKAKTNHLLGGWQRTRRGNCKPWNTKQLREMVGKKRCQPLLHNSNRTSRLGIP